MKRLRSGVAQVAAIGRLSIIALMVASTSVPAAAISVEVANGDWRDLPKLSQRGYNHFAQNMQAKLFEIAQSGRCAAFALKQGRLDLSLTFATQFARDGALQRVILPQLNCAEAESVLGGAVLEMIGGGDYAPDGKSPLGWYQAGLVFSFAGKNARDPGVPQPANSSDRAVADPTQTVCERVEEIGTRISAKRVCMTRSEWAEQRRRDREEVQRAQQTRCQSLDPDPRRGVGNSC